MIAMMLKSFTALSGAKFEMTLDGKGAVTGVKGWGSVMKEAMGGIGEASGMPPSRWLCAGAARQRSARGIYRQTAAAPAAPARAERPRRV